MERRAWAAGRNRRHGRKASEARSTLSPSSSSCRLSPRCCLKPQQTFRIASTASFRGVFGEGLFSLTPERNMNFLSNDAVTLILQSSCQVKSQAGPPFSCWLTPGSIQVSWTPFQGRLPDHPSPDEVWTVLPLQVPTARVWLVSQSVPTYRSSPLLAFLSRLCMKTSHCGIHGAQTVPRKRQHAVNVSGMDR